MLIPDDGVNAALWASPPQQRAHTQPGLDVPAQGGILGQIRIRIQDRIRIWVGIKKAGSASTRC